MAQSKPKNRAKVPEFKNEEEMRAFWDSHSPLDYPDHFEEAVVKFSKPLIKKGLTIKLSEETIEQMREIGREQGIGPSTLARIWILEHLRKRLQDHP